MRQRYITFSRVICLGAIVLICSSAPAQNLFVSGSDATGGKIFEFTPNGVQSIFASGLSSPGALAFDSAGNLFVADWNAASGGQIVKFSPDGTQSTFALGLGFDYPEGLAFDSAGNLFVADGGSILKFTPDGARSTFASGLDGAWALAFDSADNLFVTNSLDVVGPGHAHVYKFTPAGVRTTIASGLLAPTALAFDSAGNLFVLESGDIDGLGDAIYKFTPNGKRNTFAKPFQCIGPSLVIDSADNLFVPDWCTGDIHKFTRRAVESTFVSGSDHATGSYLAFQPTQGSPPPPQIVATPSVSPDGGKFRRRVMVTLTDITPGTTIYYTLDGSDPTTTSLPYLGAFRLRHSATVKTIAVDSSGNESGIATALFTKKRRH